MDTARNDQGQRPTVCALCGIKLLRRDSRGDWMDVYNWTVCTEAEDGTVHNAADD